MQPDEKPKSLSVSDYLVTVTATELNIDPAVVDAVIRHQWRSAAQLIKEHWSLEISGLGYFSCSRQKISQQLIRMQCILAAYQELSLADLPAGKRAALSHRVATCKAAIAQYSKKLQNESRLERARTRNL